MGPHSQNGLNKIPVLKHLNEFHGQMIALGAAIGTGFLIGSGQALRVAGPVSALLAFAYVGLTAYLSIYALGELSSAMPIQGAFIVFSGRFLDQAWGAAIGWNYGLQWLFVFPLELIAASSPCTIGREVIKRQLLSTSSSFWHLLSLSNSSASGDSVISKLV